MNFKKEWITDRITETAISEAESFGRALHDGRFTTSQIRNFFGEVKRIQMKGISGNESAFLLLKPKLAYSAKRASARGAEDFKKIIDQAIDSVQCGQAGADKRFQNFCDLLEAILAYHKAAGGN